jgi:hypothetical protein
MGQVQKAVPLTLAFCLGTAAGIEVNSLSAEEQERAREK